MNAEYDAICDNCDFELDEVDVFECCICNAVLCDICYVDHDCADYGADDG